MKSIDDIMKKKYYCGDLYLLHDVSRCKVIFTGRLNRKGKNKIQLIKIKTSPSDLKINHSQ